MLEFYLLNHPRSRKSLKAMVTSFFMYVFSRTMNELKRYKITIATDKELYSECIEHNSFLDCLIFEHLLRFAFL